MRRRIGFLVPAVVVAVALGVLLSGGTGLGQNAKNDRVSVSSGGVEAKGPSLQAAVSADGRFVAFASDAWNLVPGDTATRDVFVHDRQTRITERVSASSGGAGGNGPSSWPSISGDGRYVVFQSDANNLVANDDNNATDIFVRDRIASTTTLVSVSSDETQANEESVTPSISADGRFVTFTSLADNLIADDTNQDRDVFVRDVVAGATELISLATDGTHGDLNSGGFGAGPARISADGRYVVFGSFATNLIDGDTNGFDDVFLRDRIAGTTERASVATSGAEGDGHSLYGSVSDDGRFVFFHSDAENLVADDSNGVSDIFCRDRVAGETVRISEGPGGLQADGASRFVTIAGGGTLAVYQSEASNLIEGDGNAAQDIFSFNLLTGETQRVSSTHSAGDADGPSSFGAVSSDGSIIVFQSTAAILVPADNNGVADIFAYGKALAPARSPTVTPSRTPTPTFTPTPTGQAQRVGDANGDRQINSIDAALVLQFAAGLLPAPPNGPYSDANQDGETDSIDAALILQYTAGFIGQLPP